ncbi:MAG: hypothetical protein K1X72_07760 [Pyrinomonadaceae bacterium]|nr:hypothetical protein [Pyrinomonadaceae bacterium]
MPIEITSKNPVVKAIVEGSAPMPARLAAAKGLLPLPQADLLEALAFLAKSDDAELVASATKTLSNQDSIKLLGVLEMPETAPAVLNYFAEKSDLPKEIYQRVIINPNTPDNAIIKIARQTRDGELLELITLNQQRLIRVPAIIDAILNNNFRTVEADRKASETKREFFEKERGAQQIANELRARGQEAAAEFIEKSEFADTLDGQSELSYEDALLIAQHIEIPDSEIDDSWLSLEYIEEFYEESPEEREAIVNKIVGEIRFEEDDVSNERVSAISRILKMTMKDRVKLAMKGDREARNILIRDPNRVVCQAVIQNPRLTEQEVEKIAAMRTVPDDVLRQIAINRTWARNYMIMHTLAKNPRTPIGNVVSILTRLQLRDLIAISKNRNVSEAVRKQAFRLVNARAGK